MAEDRELTEPHHAFWASGIRRQAAGRPLASDELVSAEVMRPVLEQVEAMVGTDGWRFLSSLLERRRDELLARFTRGRALEREQYVELAADVRALEQLMQYPDVVRRVAAEAQERADRAAREAQAAGGSGGEDGRS